MGFGRGRGRGRGGGRRGGRGGGRGGRRSYDMGPPATVIGTSTLLEICFFLKFFSNEVAMITLRLAPFISIVEMFTLFLTKPWEYSAVPIAFFENERSSFGNKTVSLSFIHSHSLSGIFLHLTNTNRTRNISPCV